MSTRFRTLGLSVAAVATLLAGCSDTVAGTAKPVGSDGHHGDFESLLHECDAVSDKQIAKAVGGDSIARGFFGAICRWDAAGPGGDVKITFNWFETGSLEIERSTDQQLKYAIKDVTVQGRKAIQAQPPNDPDSCGVTAGAPDSGIIGWWVQYRPGSAHPDPCEAATKLADMTLNLSR